jgi:hypothetical protein
MAKTRKNSKQEDCYAVYNEIVADKPQPTAKDPEKKAAQEAMDDLWSKHRQLLKANETHLASDFEATGTSSVQLFPSVSNIQFIALLNPVAMMFTFLSEGRPSTALAWHISRVYPALIINHKFSHEQYMGEIVFVNGKIQSMMFAPTEVGVGPQTLSDALGFWSPKWGARK